MAPATNLQKLDLGKEAAPRVLGDREGVLPTDPAVLFLAFLVANCERPSSEIEKWASATLVESREKRYG